MISNIDQRVLFWDSSESSFTDLTKAVNEHHSNSESLTFDADDYLYVGTYLPFNHKYFELSANNVTVATPTIETWNGTEWVAVPDNLDYTEASGASFGQSGILQFTPSWDNEWSLVDRTTEVPALTEFANGPEIFNKYWLRIGFSAPGVAFGLKYVGSLFASESDLLAEYSHLRDTILLDSWETGKTDWLDQRVIASEYIVTELKKRSIIKERSQILDISILQEPCVHRAAEIIYSGLGPKNYESEISNAGKRYGKAINLNKFEVDVNMNGKKERGEQTITTRRMTR